MIVTELRERCGALGVDHLRLLRDIAKHGTYDEAAGRRLAGIIADTATQTGWFTFDSGQPDEAQLYFLRVRPARRGIPRLGAGALSYIAIRGYSTGHPRDAVTAARAALDKVKTLNAPALEAMLLTRQARGHAMLGEQQAALKALGQATELCARGRSEHDPHSCTGSMTGRSTGKLAAVTSPSAAHGRRSTASPKQERHSIRRMFGPEHCSSPVQPLPNSEKAI
ncbi:hypothetical protein WKI65_22445 [Streptomyces sp. MS1.AVA.3]|uniref:hypothetical protein n=1 Tax=Streptomyces decoyicus TaxID=249567 RepID=UPI0030C114F9